MKFYYLLLSFHLIAVITWISSIVYLGRLIFLQVENKNTYLQKEAYFIYKKISMPAFICTISLGLILIFLNKTVLKQDFGFIPNFLLFQ